MRVVSRVTSAAIDPGLTPSATRSAATWNCGAYTVGGIDGGERGAVRGFCGDDGDGDAGRDGGGDGGLVVGDGLVAELALAPQPDADGIVPGAREGREAVVALESSRIRVDNLDPPARAEGALDRGDAR